MNRSKSWRRAKTLLSRMRIESSSPTFKTALNRGEIRAAEKTASGQWSVNSWVKQGILLGFRMGSLVDMSAGGPLRFLDKDTYPVRP